MKRWIHPVDHVAVVVAESGQGMDQLHLEELSPGPDKLSFGEWKKQVLEDTNLQEDRKKQLGDLLEQHRSTFADEPGLTDRIEFCIDTGQEKPVATAPRQPPLKWEKQHDETIEALYQKGILENSNSPWVSATHCVAKGATGCRVVVDTRSVNSRTVPDPYPMPRPSSILDAVAASPFISTLDLNSGYYQIPVRKEDRPKTAIITHKGKFQFTRMPFGFKGAPACFQRLMDQLFKGQPQIKAYTDDIVVYSPTW